MDRGRLRKNLFALLQYGVSLGILGYLIWDASRNDTFANLIAQPKNWGMLFAAWAVCMVGLALTFVRWHALVRALDMPFAMRDAFRLGFLGYLFNFVSFGAVGGDVIKAIMLVREQPKHRAEAVATVLVDRIIGLYALLVFASIFILGFNQLNSPQPEIRRICGAALLGTLGLTAALGVLMIPAVTRHISNWKPFGSEKAEHVVRRLSGALGMYRSRPTVLVAAMLYSFGVHGAFTFGIYLVSRGLPGDAPGLAGHFVIVPLTLITGVLPLPVNGLGAFEGVLNYLYQVYPSGKIVADGQGLMVALGYRAITILIAMIGVVFYLMYRREVTAVLNTAQAEEQAAEEELEHRDDVVTQNAPA